MSLPRMPAAVVFDMDGLLFDTERLYLEALHLATAEIGCDVAPDFFIRTIGLTSPQCRALLLTQFGEAFAVDVFQAAWLRHFWLIAETRLTLKPGVLELLDALDQFGLPRAIATSSSPQTVERHLAASSLVGRFDVIVARGDYDAGKPAPDPFLAAAERMYVEPRLCLALEDSHNGVRSASSAGMMTVMVPDLLEPTEEISALCHLVACDLHEVRRLIIAAADGPGIPEHMTDDVSPV
jgi:HAD superfamily hydrolase (TIGR01509 family)